MNVEGTKEFAAPRERVWAIISDPAGMAGLMPGVEGFEVIDDTHWRAKVKVPLGLGGLKMTMDFEQLEERPLEFASMRGKGKGMGAMMDMTTSFTLSGEGDHTHMAWEADVKLAGVLASMGQRVLQPIVNQQVEGIMTALEKQLARAGMTLPFRVGVMQLTMEPLEEMLESARVMDEAGLDTIWLAEAYPWWRKHGMEAKSSTVLAGMIAPRDEAADRGLGDHLALHAPSRAGGHGRAPRAGGRRAGPLHRRLRHVQDLPQQHQAGRPAEGHEAARHDARLGRDHARRARAASASSTTARCSRPTSRRSRRMRTCRAGTCRSTWPARRR